jgi:hypothetical protein
MKIYLFNRIFHALVVYVSLLKYTPNPPLPISFHHTYWKSRLTQPSAVPPKNRYPQLPFLVALLLFSAVLAAIDLYPQPFWFDEWISMRYAGGEFYGPMTFPQIWERMAQGDPSQSPFYYLVLSVWGQLAGWSPFALRTFSWMCGLLAVAWTYRAGRELHSWRAGVGSAMALSACAFFIYHMHEARMYTLTPLLTAISVWAYARTQSKPTKLTYVVLVLSLVALVYTHHVAILVPAALGAYHVLTFPHRTKSWWIVLCLLIAAGLFYTPWLFGVTLRGASDIQTSEIWRAISKPPVNAVNETLLLFANGSVALLLIFAYFAWDRRNPSTRMVWFLALIAFAAALVVNIFIPFLTNIRYLLVLFPLLAVLIGIGAARITHQLNRGGLKNLGRVLIALWIGGGAWVTLNPDILRDAWILYLRWDRLAEQINPLAQEGDALVFMIPFNTPGWIHEATSSYYLRDVPVSITRLDTLADQPPEIVEAQIADVMALQPTRVWVAHAPEQPPGQLAPREMAQALQANFVECANTYSDLEISRRLYARVFEGDSHYQFSGGDSQIGVSLLELFDVPTPRSLSSDHPLRLTVEFAIPPDLPYSRYSVGLHILDSSDNLAAQEDFPLPTPTREPNGLINACYGTSIPLENLAAGEYQLNLVIYAWETGERLLTTNTQSDTLMIGSIVLDESG